MGGELEVLAAGLDDLVIADFVISPVLEAVAPSSSDHPVPVLESHLDVIELLERVVVVQTHLQI